MSPRNEIPAPDIDPSQLWSLSPDAFNAWRQQHDFPRVVAYLKTFSGFNRWQAGGGASDAELIEFGPAVFLRPQRKGFVHIQEIEAQTGVVARQVTPEPWRPRPDFTL